MKQWLMPMLASFALSVQCHAETTQVLNQDQKSYADSQNRIEPSPTTVQASKQPLYQSGSECGPDQPQPVWGAGNKFLGYTCAYPSANGN